MFSSFGKFALQTEKSLNLVLWDLIIPILISVMSGVFYEQSSCNSNSCDKTNGVIDFRDKI